MPITHPFVSAIADGSDATLVRPSNWNADHTIANDTITAVMMATGSVDVATNTITGILPTANGGTGIAFFTAAGPTVARVYTFPDAAATIARSDAANTFTGIQTFSTPIASASMAAMSATVGGRVPTPPNNTTTFLRGDGTFAAPSTGGITLATEQASTSGTAIDFTGIPAGTQRIVIMFDAVSTSSTSRPLIQLGDAGGFEATGYISSSLYLYGATPVFTSSTAGFVINSTAAANVLSGSVILNLENSTIFTWVISGSFAETSDALIVTAGRKALSAELTQVRITTENGTDTFDAGAINISYQ